MMTATSTTTIPSNQAVAIKVDNQHIPNVPIGTLGMATQALKPAGPLAGEAVA